MTATIGAPTLHVEGPEDQHTILHLLLRHNIACGLAGKSPGIVDINPVGGAPALLDSMVDAIELAGSRPVGFVLDADNSLESRWRAVRDRLARVCIPTPDVPPTAGFIGRLGNAGARTGVWLMPDNSDRGAIEHFLDTLVGEDDALRPHARNATQQAKKLGAAFSDSDAVKAELHTWLAWQKEPGLRYGVAIKEKYFAHDSEAAIAFVTWFRTLYGIAELPLPGAE